MSTVKLTTTHKWKAGRTHVLPIVGTVTWDETGSIEVHEDHADALKAALPELDPDAIDPQVQQNDLGRSREKEDDIVPQVQEAAPLELNSAKREELMATLSSLKKEDLQELAVDFPKEEWQDLKKEDLKAYLADKL